MSSFGFDNRNSEDFHTKLCEDYAEFMKDTFSSRVAINCAMTAWHLTEWVYHESFTGTYSKNAFQTKLKAVCPSLQIMNDIADGTKHWVLSRTHEIDRTGVHDGDFDPADFNDDFDVSRLIITKKDGTVLDFIDELENVMTFWRDFFSRTPWAI